MNCFLINIASVRLEKLWNLKYINDSGTFIIKAVKFYSAVNTDRVSVLSIFHVQINIMHKTKLLK